MKTYHSIMAKIAALQEEAAALKKAERTGVIARIQEALKVYGISIQELQSPVPRKLAATPKKLKRKLYRNPNNMDQTWTGHGTHPTWLKELEAAGHDKSKFEVKS